jgi:hypothetical protein
MGRAQPHLRVRPMSCTSLERSPSSRTMEGTCSEFKGAWRSAQ